MKADLARRHLDERFKKIKPYDKLAIPQKGWLRAIREALGLTQAHIAKRLGVSTQRITTLEIAERQKSITLATLEKAAQAMECQLIYAIVPQKSLQDILEARAKQKAAGIMNRSRHTMGLENQTAAEKETTEQEALLLKSLLGGNLSRLWDE